MKVLFKLFLLVLIAIILALLINSGHAHVILFIGDYRIDLSLTMFILLDLILFLFFYYLIRIFVGIQNFSHKITAKSK